MDADVRSALFDPDYEYQDLPDDFIQRLGEVPASGGGAEEDREAFDYDAHIAKLIAGIRLMR
jgi:hypothetical protein